MFRLVFSKTGSARFISHLDLVKLMKRTIRRAEIPVWNTEGFNPHPYMNFCAPLSVGIEGNYEFMDFKLSAFMENDEILKRFNQNLPLNIKAVDLYETETKFNDVCFAEYIFSFPEDIKNELETFISKENIEVVKKSKKSEETINLKDEVNFKKPVYEKEKTLLSSVFPCGNNRNVNPLLFITAFFGFLGEERQYYITRNNFYDADMNLFK